MKKVNYKKIALAFGMFGSVAAGYAADIQLVTKNYVAGGLATKQDAPEAAGTTGQVLGLDAMGNAVWVDQTAATDVSGKQDVIDAGTAGDVMIYSGVAGTVDSVAVDSNAGGTAASADLITSGAVAAGLATKQDEIVGGVENSGRVLGVDGTGEIGWINPAETDISGKQDTIGAGTPGNVMTYSGTAGTVNSVAVDSNAGGTSASADLITSGAVAAGLAAKQDAIVGGAANDGRALIGTTSGYIWVDVVDTY